MDSNGTEEEMTADAELNCKARQANRQLDVHRIKAKFAFRRNRRAAMGKRCTMNQMSRRKRTKLLLPHISEQVGKADGRQGLILPRTIDTEDPVSWGKMEIKATANEAGRASEQNTGTIHEMFVEAFSTTQRLLMQSKQTTRSSLEKGSSIKPAIKQQV
jgi:hypothetical protein